jgi:hypothetical protein
MPHQSVIPAKIKPAPMKADSAWKAALTNAPKIVPMSTRVPAAMRTCRSREIVFAPRSTGPPA